MNSKKRRFWWLEKGTTTTLAIRENTGGAFPCLITSDKGAGHKTFVSFHAAAGASEPGGRSH